LLEAIASDPRAELELRVDAVQAIARLPEQGRGALERLGDSDTTEVAAAARASFSA
jgi:hypothetical protein